MALKSLPTSLPWFDRRYPALYEIEGSVDLTQSQPSSYSFGEMPGNIVPPSAWSFGLAQLYSAVYTQGTVSNGLATPDNWNAVAFWTDAMAMPVAETVYVPEGTVQVFGNYTVGSTVDWANDGSLKNAINTPYMYNVPVAAWIRLPEIMATAPAWPTIQTVSGPETYNRANSGWTVYEGMLLHVVPGVDVGSSSIYPATIGGDEAGFDVLYAPSLATGATPPLTLNTYFGWGTSVPSDFDWSNAVMFTGGVLAAARIHSNGIWYKPRATNDVLITVDGFYFSWTMWDSTWMPAPSPVPASVQILSLSASNVVSVAASLNCYHHRTVTQASAQITENWQAEYAGGSAVVSQGANSAQVDFATQTPPAAMTGTPSALGMSGAVGIAGTWNVGLPYGVGEIVAGNETTAGDLVSYLVYYVCIVANTGESVTNTAYWQEVGTLFTVSVSRGSWANSTVYSVGDIVTDESGGVFYICAVGNTGQPVSNAAYWHKVGNVGDNGKIVALTNQTSAWTINGTELTTEAYLDGLYNQAVPVSVVAQQTTYSISGNPDIPYSGLAPYVRPGGDPDTATDVYCPAVEVGYVNVIDPSMTIPASTLSQWEKGRYGLSIGTLTISETRPLRPLCIGS